MLPVSQHGAKDETPWMRQWKSNAGFGIGESLPFHRPAATITGTALRNRVNFYMSIYRHESDATSRRLGVMNRALRGIEADFGSEPADTFRRDLHSDLRADYVLANPPFNDSDWFCKDDAVRWQFGVTPMVTPLQRALPRKRHC